MLCSEIIFADPCESLSFSQGCFLGQDLLLPSRLELMVLVRIIIRLAVAAPRFPCKWQ